MICRQCGTEIADKAIVCDRCGACTTDPVRQPAAVRPRRGRIFAGGGAGRPGAPGPVPRLRRGDDADARRSAAGRRIRHSRVRSPLTLADAKRLVPFAERHQVSIAIHNQVDGNRAGAIDTPRLAQALALSPAFALALDIGNLTASNCDAVAELREHRSRVSHVIVKDRLRNGGASQPFGEGDTPIKAVLDLLAASPAVPAMVEYDYVGLRPPVEEVRASVAYLTQHAL